jgi:DNA-binding transcriptional regulator LsrR (DeoR family)
MPSQEISPEMLAKVADFYYRGHKSREWIAAEFSRERHRDQPYKPANVNHWVEQAEERHVISFDIDPSFAIVGTRNQALEAKLNSRSAFGLEAPVVVDPPDLVNEAGDLREDLKAEALHTALANQTGIRLSQIPSDKHRFLVAGGRTVVQVARMIKRKRDTVLWSDIRVDPLSGRNWTGTWRVDGPDLQRPLDADDAALILASACRTGASFSQIGYPLYAESIDQAHAIMREHCAFLPDGSWNWNAKYRALRAICGIGSLHFDSGHRIMGFLETYLGEHGIPKEALKQMILNATFGDVDLPKKPDPSAPYLSRVALELISAITFAIRHDLGYFGDIANRLFPCLPLPESLSPDKLPRLEDFEDLLKKLDALNRRAIVMQWSHLRKASAWVTAGGPHKLKPIWTLAITRYIERERPNSTNQDDSILTHLTTDSVTATKLLDALEKFKNSETRVQQWYRDLVEILFHDDPY